jgi:hypothetical protein
MFRMKWTFLLIVQKFQSCNAVTGEGLVEGMLWLSNAILSRQFVEMTEKRLVDEKSS